MMQVYFNRFNRFCQQSHATIKQAGGKKYKIPSPALLLSVFSLPKLCIGELLHYLKGLMALGVLVTLVGCSHTASVPEPTALPEMTQTQAIQRHWQLLIGRTSDSDAVGLQIALEKDRAFSAATEGWVTAWHLAPQNYRQDQVIWQKKFKEVITAGPVVEGSMLYVGTNKGSLYALNKTNGALVWQVHLSSEVMALPVIVQDRLFTRTVDGKLYALSPATGEIIWVVEQSMPKLSLRGAAPVAVKNSVLFVGWETGHVEALSVETGERLWRQRVLTSQGRTDLERMVDLQARLIWQQGRLVVLGYHGQIQVLNPKTGLPFWTKRISGYRTPLVTDRTIFLITDKDIVQAYDLQSGALLWQQKHLRHRRLSELQAFRGQLLVSDGYGTVIRLDPLDGTLLGYFVHDEETAIVKFKADEAQQILYIQDEEGFLTRYGVVPTVFASSPKRVSDD